MMDDRQQELFHDFQARQQTLYPQPCLPAASSEVLPVADHQRVLERLTALSYRSGDVGAYLVEIVLGVSRLIQADWTIITLCEAETGQIIASSLELDWSDTKFNCHGTLADQVVQSGRSLFIPDRRQAASVPPLPQEYLGYLGVPLRAKSQQVIGTICSFLRQPRLVTEVEIEMIEAFAERTATTIENYQLYQHQQRCNEQLSQEIASCSLSLRQSQEKLIERERLAAIGEFSAMIVHEIRNPLTTIQMGLNYFARLDLSPQAQVRLSLALDETKRLANLLQEILSYSKPQVLQLAEIDLDGLIRELLVPLRGMPEAKGRVIKYFAAPLPVLILGDANKLKQVFINLIRNACEAVAVGDGIRWSVERSSSEHICISVQNGGTPIPAEVLPQLTQPFYSTKPEGTGLGLAIVKRIVEAHNGELLIESSELRGTIFTVKLPFKPDLDSSFG